MSRARLHLLADAKADLARVIADCRAAYPTNLRRLRKTFRDVFQEIEEAPLRWTIWRSPYRSRVVLQFPYRIVYRVESDAVVVVAFLHQHQDPSRRFLP